MTNEEETPKQVKQLQIQIPPDVKPVFADNFLIIPQFHEYGNIKEKDSTLNIIATNKNVVVSNITLTMRHAKAVVELLKEKIIEAENYEKTGERPKEEVIKTSKDELSYIG